MSMLRVCFVGAGDFATKVHYPSLAEMNDVEIAGICDLDEARRRSVADKYKVASTYADYREMIQKETPDAVFVVVPPTVLKPIALGVLDAGANLFIEKPPGLDVSEAREMAELAEKKGVVNMIGFNRRFIPVLVKARAQVEARGPITYAVVSYHKNFVGRPCYYDGKISVLHCDIIHAVDAVRWLGGGSVAGVSSDVRTLPGGAEPAYLNCFTAVLRFEGGAIGVLLSNFTSGKRIHEFEIHGKGIVASVAPDFGGMVYCDDKPEGQNLGFQRERTPEQRFRYYGYYDEDRHFLDCVRDKKATSCGLAEGVKTFELADRIMAEGQK